MATDREDPAVSGPDAAAALVAGRYRLGARRGASLDATLFEAFDTELGRPVVVKFLDADTSARPDVQAEFRRVMEIAGSVHHPNIAQAHAWGITERDGERVLYVVSEQLTGGSVRDMLDRGRLLSPSQALLVGLDACKALVELHRRDLVHGDIRPSTLVFGEDRRLRVVDPGLSQVLAFAEDGVHRSNDLAKYASPEQATGQTLTGKSDVYSLCLTLFETLTGGVPFVGDSTVATLANRVDKLLPVSADLGPLAAVLERAGRPDAADRCTAAEFGRALVQAAERLPRPKPLPILANSLFGIDPGNTGDGTDPTGVLRMPVVPTVASPAPTPAPPAQPTRGTGLDPTVAVPRVAAAAPRPAPAGPATQALPAVKPAPEATSPTDFDPADEFPEHPPAPGRTRKLLVVFLLLLAVAGGALAWYNARPDMRVVPELADLEEGVALNSIAGDFEGVLAQESSEDIVAGHVIRSDPAAGTELEKGSSITLFVSTGPAPRVLPDVTGKTVAEATAALEALDLTVEVADPAFDENVAEGIVLSWTVPDSPALVAGGTVTKGTAVRLVPSGGPAPRTVPDLAANDLATATAALTALQLQVQQAPDEFSPTVPVGQVVRQDPAPGATLPRGGAVTVVLSKGPQPIVIPDVTPGMAADVAVKALEAAGFTVAKVTGDFTKPLAGLAVNGAPATPGMEFPPGTGVEVIFQP